MADSSYQPKVYRKQGGDELVVASGGKLIIESGGELEVQSGGLVDLSAGVQEPGDIALARGSIIAGITGNVGAAVDAKTSGRILVGDGTDLVSVAVSGDVTLAANGAVTIGNDKITTAKILDGNVTAAKLANGAGLAALIAAGLGASAAYVKTTDGAQQLLAADPAARVALIIAVVDETFANGDGGQTTFTIGETDTVDKYAAAAIFTDAQAGDIFIFAGSLSSTKALLVTGTPATGTGTGGISVSALVLPAAA